MYKPRYLILADFDQTLFDTLSPGKNKIGVREAYMLSLADIFSNISLKDSEDWLASSGLIGGTPSQIATAFIKDTQEDPGFLDNARSFFTREKESLQGLLSNKEPLIWNDEFPEVTVASLLVAQKLRYLLGEIGLQNDNGSIWPQPCSGALDLMRKVKDLQVEGVPLDFGIVSSGHEAFIKRTLDTWKVPQPDILVTEDDIRYRKYPSESERRFKPGTFPIGLAHYKWMRQWYEPGKNLRIASYGEESKKRIMMVGDSVTKDLFMARGAKVESHYLVPFTPLQAIADVIDRKRDLFDGRPFTDITRGIKDGQEVDILKPDNLEPRYRFSTSRERR